LIGSVLGFGVAAVGVTAAQAAGTVTLNPNSGKSGTAVTVTGTGFPKRTNGTITVGSSVTAVTSSSSGYVTANITIPTNATGKVTVSVKIGTTTASAVFTVTAVVVAPVVPAPSTARLRFGAATSGTTTAELDSLATLVNEGPSLVTFYQDWNQPVPVTILNQIDARGATPVIAWEPWAWGGDANQPTYSLQNIISGNFDAYINQWAVGLKNYGKKVMLRFAHEMNGDWYPWSERVNGNSAGQYVSAWRHVRDIFTANGVTNVQWVWNPNVNSYGMTDYASIFPGADYVDIVGLDGYNWGTTQTWGSTWQNPSDLFDGSITLLRSIAPGKAILIAETASAETGGDKAAWNSDLITYLNAQPDVMGFIWFNLNKEVDWRVESSTTSANALKTALASRL
jgi:hypothetical protein